MFVVSAVANSSRGQVLQEDESQSALLLTSVFFFALCCLGKIPGGAPFSQLHKSGNGSRVDRP